MFLILKIDGGNQLHSNSIILTKHLGKLFLKNNNTHNNQSLTGYQTVLSSSRKQQKRPSWIKLKTNRQSEKTNKYLVNHKTS